MSKPLSKILNQKLMSRLNKNDIYVEEPFLLQSITLEGIELHIRKQYVKPSSKESKQQSFTDKMISAFNTERNKILDDYEDFRDRFVLLSHEELKQCIYDSLHRGSIGKEFISDLYSNMSLKSMLKEKTILQNVTDYPETFPKARARKRTIHAYLGPTNSGKTWQAINKLKQSQNSAYMAPLRLLALETYETLNDQGVNTSLVTGEERDVRSDSICTSSTVECFDPDTMYDTVVIDEIQMIDDFERGCFFIQALIGANAKDVIVTGPEEYKGKLEEICKYLGEDLVVEKFYRKSKLQQLRKPTSLDNVKKNTAIVAFSRKEVYNIRKSLPPHIKSTVLYGALGHEVRKTQAERFANGDVDVIVTTDCIGMGLNLPIETVLFSAHSKFNGQAVVPIGNMLTKQICGRAGRFGKFDTGYYGALDQNVLKYLSKEMSHDLKPKKGKLKVLPPKEYVEKLLDGYNLSDILINWADSYKFSEGSMFVTDPLKRQIEIAEYLEKSLQVNMGLIREFWRLIYCPIDLPKDYAMFHDVCQKMFNNENIKTPTADPVVMGQMDLEIYLKEINMLLWFSNHFDEYMDRYAKEDLKDLLYDVTEEINIRLSRK